MSDLMTPEELAARLGKSADFWKKAARAGRVPHRRIGRSIAFTEEDAAQILENAKVEVVDPLRLQTSLSRARTASPSGLTPRSAAYHARNAARRRA
jgi:hypothetical protein